MSKETNLSEIWDGDQVSKNWGNPKIYANKLKIYVKCLWYIYIYMCVCRERGEREREREREREC